MTKGLEACSLIFRFENCFELSGIKPLSHEPRENCFFTIYVIFSMFPTTIINHEFGHAAGYDSDPKAYRTRLNTYDKQYDDAEEKRVITGVEQRTARALGNIGSNQVTRTDHTFKRLLFTTDPTSNKGTPRMILMKFKTPIVINGSRSTKVNPKKDQ